MINQNERRWRTNKTNEEKKNIENQIAHMYICVITFRQYWDLCSIIPLFVSFIFFIRRILVASFLFSISFDYIFRVFIRSNIRLNGRSIIFGPGKKGWNRWLSDIGRRKRKNCSCDRLWCIHCVSYVKTENAIKFTRLQQFSPKKEVFEFYKNNNSLYSCAVSLCHGNDMATDQTANGRHEIK